MKILIILLIFTPFLTCFGQISSNNTYLIVESIYKIENSVKYPYGIRSMPIEGTNQAQRIAYCRRICLVTVQNQYKRWASWGKTNNYLDSLANRYCPSSCDKIGNLNWKKNIYRMLDGKVNIQ